MSVGVGLRQWLSKGSPAQGLFLQTIVRRRRIPSGTSLSLSTYERACPLLNNEPVPFGMGLEGQALQTAQGLYEQPGSGSLTGFGAPGSRRGFPWSVDEIEADAVGS